MLGFTISLVRQLAFRVFSSNAVRNDLRRRVLVKMLNKLSDITLKSPRPRNHRSIRFVFNNKSFIDCDKCRSRIVNYHEQIKRDKLFNSFDENAIDEIRAKIEEELVQSKVI